LVLFPNIARRGPREGGNKHASIGELYKREEATHDEQLTWHLQRLDEQFERFGDQIGALTEQVAAMGGEN